MLSVAGTVIGAGFATGKELQLFFKSPDVSSLLWLLCSLVLMAFFSLLYWSKKKAQSTPSSLLQKLSPLFLTFSGGTYAIMLSCGGEALWESFSLPGSVGILITWGVTLLIVKFGIQSVYRFNLIATPILLVSMIGISFASLLLPVGLFGSQNVPFFNMLTYTGYNLLSVLPFLDALPKETSLLKGSLGIGAGFFLIAVVGVLLKAVLNLHHNTLSDEAIPMLKIMSLLSSRLSYLYIIMLYGSILTTSVNCLYAVTKGNHTFLASGLLLGIGFFGFSTLLENLYSFFGYLGIGVIFLILLEKFIKPKSKKGFFKYDK